MGGWKEGRMGMRTEEDDRKCLAVMAELENYEKVVDFIGRELEACTCDEKTAVRIQTAVEEVFVNIASYAYEPDRGETLIRIWTKTDPDQIWVQFCDHGKPFNPLERPDPDLNLKLEDRQTGGLGIFMVKEFMDEVTYVYKDKTNILSFGISYKKQV